MEKEDSNSGVEDIRSADQGVRDTYTDDQSRSLTDAVLDAIERAKGDDLDRTDFDIFEDINPTALDTLFKPNARSTVTVVFSTEEVHVELWVDGGTQIRVRDRSSE